mmetsp:Transcript_26026/g.87227  ORF Transcript_26026/g.87227 Transcript_26026/m.87227 type:complete len:164 (-) Transcript_26026:182-673(-)
MTCGRWWLTRLCDRALAVELTGPQGSIGARLHPVRMSVLHRVTGDGRCTAMDDLQSSEEAAFVPEEVDAIVKESVESVLQAVTYTHARVPQWTSDVIEACMKRLTQLHKPFKYIVTCAVMQKTGAGLHLASSCYWDSAGDGSVTHRWESKTMYCVVSVFGLAV